MTTAEIMNKLEQMGTEQTRRTFQNHGASQPLFGVKIGDLKKLVKEVRKDQQLAAALYATGNSDAMYLAGLAIDPASIKKELLQTWVKQANWYMLSEYTVAGVAAESPYALELAREWMDSDEELIAACGWSTYANYISVTPDADLDLNEIRSLLDKAEQTIHSERNRVRYTMNGFVIIAGSAVASLHEEALAAAGRIGKVQVNMGQTACKVPPADAYIQKVKARGKIGVKKKTCIC
ncbi:DNA alkylation repair protein [Paenibacillus nasutitermitis]|nr:DNA alkylation repair protein [Paenibacillus nasutitermitis]